MPPWAQAPGGKPATRAAAMKTPNQPRIPSSPACLRDAVALAIGEHLLVVRPQRAVGVLLQILEQIGKPRNRANLQPELAFDELHTAVVGVLAVLGGLLLPVQCDRHPHRARAGGKDDVP